ncbi:MAG: CoA-binding protein [Promethearchaeota archaeon]|nr:MAG: CoA-binding protein [Candidatus Lokiarchaeota archaeon]
MTSPQISSLNVKDLSFMNHIKTMAIIGVSQKRDFFFLRNHQENFQGDIYVIHPSLKTIPNFDDTHIYRSVIDVPKEVDFVFIAVPPREVVNVMKECAQKGVKLASIFTAEFSDAGTEEGRKLEEELLKSTDDKVRFLGPNGMGLYYPKLGIAWRPHFPKIPGNIGFIAQSGGICNISIYMAQELGISFSKVFSFGNGADLDIVDLIYFLSNDDETDIILCYVEGIKENRGKDLQKVLKLNKKPIIFLKGGKTETGSIAAKTHTASISGQKQIWSSLFHQYNAIEVESLEQMLYTTKILDYYGPFLLENLAVFSISGGYGVILVDLIVKNGMKVPPFSPEIQEKLDEKFFVLGTSSKNPLDVSAQIYRSEVMREIIDTALSDKKIDGLIMDLPSWYFNVDFHLKKDYTFEPTMIESLSLGHKHKKALFPIIQRVNCPEARKRVVKKLNEKKVPVFAEPLEFISLLPKISEYTKRMKSKRS